MSSDFGDALRILADAKSAAFDAILDYEAGISLYIYRRTPRPAGDLIDFLEAWRWAANAQDHLWKQP